jgi:hypothetical protein
VRVIYAGGKESQRGVAVLLGRDHNVVTANVIVKLKRQLRKGSRIKKRRLDGIEEKGASFQNEIVRELARGDGGSIGSVEDGWKEFTYAVNMDRRRNDWISESKKSQEIMGIDSDDYEH